MLKVKERYCTGKTSHGRFGGSFDSPIVDAIVNCGNPILNSSLDGFIKVGGVGVAHAALQDTFTILKTGNGAEGVTKHDLEKMVKRAGREGFQWGLVAGVYAGMEYGMERVRGKNDWLFSPPKAVKLYMKGAEDYMLWGDFRRCKELKNAALGGALTGALVSFTDGNFTCDKLVQHTITGGALATASEFIRNIT